MEVIQIKLKRDLLKMSLECSADLDIDKEEFTEWINTRIDYHMNQKKITFQPLVVKSKHSIGSRCKARLYTNRTGKDQCTHQCIKDTPYCLKHTTMLEREKVLRFGDISEEIPQYDLIKQKQGISERLYWEHSDPIQQLQGVLDLQNRKVIISTPRLILS